MKIKNIANPSHGFAEFSIRCDFCGEEIGTAPSNVEFHDHGEAFCLHKHCSEAFRRRNKGGRLYWIELQEVVFRVRDGLESHEINLRKDLEDRGGKTNRPSSDCT